MPKRLVEAIYYNNPDYLPPLINGSRLLAENDWRVTILCRNNLPPCGIKYELGVRLLRFEPRNQGHQASWKTYWRFVRATLRHTDPTTALFVGHDMHGFLPARLLATRYRRPLVYHCHDFVDKGNAQSLGSRVVQSFERRFARTADLVIVPDADRARIIKRDLHLPKMPLVAANSPIDHFARDSGVLRAALAKQGACFTRILLRQGTTGVGHGLEKTIESMPLWKSQEWGFVLLGPSEPAYAESLHSLARSLGVGSQLAILPAVRYQDVARYTVGADAGHALYDPIHFNHRHSTTASNKLMEYMAAGLPLMASDTPTLRALVERHACGVTADETSIHSIADATNRLLAGDATTQAMGIASHRAFDEEFRYARQFAPVLRAMENLVPLQGS